MYFFLLNLSVLDLGSIFTTVPKAMANSLWDTRAISYPGCAAQLFLFLFLMSAEYFLLTVMAYDRYVAICKPLHYGTLLGSRACVHMAAAAWGSGFLHAVLHTANTFAVPLCQGNAVDQFFCEIPQILKLACSDAYLGEAGLLILSSFLDFGCFVFIVLSYVQIFRAVLRIPSEQGRQKAFSMCLPHLAVISLVISTGLFSYLKPPSTSSPSFDVVFAVVYSVVPPAVNPLIYSMRNQELKGALRKLGPVTSHKGLAEVTAKEVIPFLSLTCSYTLEVQQQAHMIPVYSFTVNELVSAHLPASILPCISQDNGTFGFGIIPTSWDKVSAFCLQLSLLPPPACCLFALELSQFTQAAF
ncbi:olfactory receptor 14A16-like [Haliaeetus albicilla]|uniref:olfactory receptor 14A16-like n=1 Tax=Haliaeetus albicilla TaxID=8969 RepID=UPI0037E805FD